MKIYHKTTRELIFDCANLDFASLRGANLSDANLSDASLRGANLSDANLNGAYLSDADLRDANLNGAYLNGANLRGANLNGADLRGANLRGASGNRLEIKSLFISDDYPITYTSDVLQIGCELHDIAEWWGFDDKRIVDMDGKQALKFWRKYKGFIKQAIELSPAKPAGSNK
jgi:uncharacterized protein YjbI with pentapeptide repeats